MKMLFRRVNIYVDQVAGQLSGSKLMKIAVDLIEDSINKAALLYLSRCGLSSK